MRTKTNFNAFDKGVFVQKITLRKTYDLHEDAG